MKINDSLIYDSLKKIFGFDECKGLQKEVIKHKNQFFVKEKWINYIEDLCKKVIMASDMEDWEDQITKCFEDSNSILGLSTMEEVEKTAEEHQLTDYSAALIYHSKNFSNE